MTIGRDLLKSLGIIINHSTETITWNDSNIPMKKPMEIPTESFHIKDPTGFTKC